MHSRRAVGAALHLLSHRAAFQPAPSGPPPMRTGSTRSIRRRSLSLYLHVPYCARLCHYCGCHTKIVQRRAPVDAYAELLAQEIDLVAARTKRQRVSLDPLGRRHALDARPRRLVALSERIARRFDCSRVAEHAIEIDPRQSRRRARAGARRDRRQSREPRRAGISPHVQQAIGRVQPFETVAAAVAVLRAAGIADLNFDLMYGLPHQSRQNLHDTCGAPTRSARPHRAVRLCACAVDQDASAPDR